MRTLVYNIYALHGYLHPRGQQRPRPAGQNPTEWAKLIADIITLCEVNNEPSAQSIADQIDLTCIYYAGHLDVAGALLTSFPIIEQANLPKVSVPEGTFVAHWGRSLLETPYGSLVVLNLHPAARSGPEVIHQEVSLVAKMAADDLASGHSVIVQGDFNHVPHAPHAQTWKKAGLTDCFQKTGGIKDNGKTLVRPEPVARLNYILAAGTILNRLNHFEIPSNLELRPDPKNPARIVLSNHLPILADFSD